MATTAPRGNTCRQPVVRGGRAAAEERSARPGHRGPRRARSSHASPLLSPPRAPPRRPLPKESSHRRPRDTAASRGPAPERAPPGCGRRRRGSGGGREGDAGPGPRRSPLRARGAAAARARPNLAGACGAKTLPDGAAGHATGRSGIEGETRGRRAWAQGPTDRRPKRADVRAPPTTHAPTPRREAHAPPGHPRSHLSLSGPTRTGRRRRRRRRRRRAQLRRPRRPRGPRLRDPPPHNPHGRISLPTRIPADRPRGGRDPEPDDAPHPSTPGSHGEFPTGRGQGNGGGGAGGGKRRRAEGGQEDPRGGGGQASERPHAGRDRRTTATDDDAHTRLDLGRRRARAGPCEQAPSRATTPFSPRERGEGEAIDRQATLRQA